MPMSAAKSFYFVNKAFSLWSIKNSFRLNRLELSFTADVICLGSRPPMLKYNGYTFENVCWLAYETSRLWKFLKYVYPSCLFYIFNQATTAEDQEFNLLHLRFQTDAD